MVAFDVADRWHRISRAMSTLVGLILGVRERARCGANQASVAPQGS